jgi:hypothetical protein
LLGADDLVGGPLAAHAAEQLSWIESVALEVENLRREDLLPIAARRDDLDLFVLARRTAGRPGEVIWFAGGVIERYENFDDYFSAMVDLNRDTVAMCEAELNSSID